MKLEAVNVWTAKKSDNNFVSLIKAIKGLSHKCDDIKYHANYLCDIHCDFYTLNQHKLKNAAFLGKFKLKVEIIEQYGGELGVSATGLKEARKEVADPKYEVEVKALICTKYLAVSLILTSEYPRHVKILYGLENDYLKGEKNYPKDVSASFNYLTNYQGDRRNVELRSEDLHFANAARKNAHRQTEINHCGNILSALDMNVVIPDT